MALRGPQVISGPKFLPWATPTLHGGGLGLVTTPVVPPADTVGPGEMPCSSINADNDGGPQIGQAGVAIRQHTTHRLVVSIKNELARGAGARNSA